MTPEQLYLEELYPDIICSLTHEIMINPVITNPTTPQI